MVDKFGNIIKNMDIVTKDLTKLVIIDDGDMTYNLYKSIIISVVKIVSRKYY